jgi:hypothetical protein
MFGREVAIAAPLAHKTILAPHSCVNLQLLLPLRVISAASFGSTTYLLFSKRKSGILPVGNQNGGVMKQAFL